MLALAAAVEGAGTGVHAVGVGWKVVAGVAKRALCIRFYVVQKLDPGVLPKSLARPSGRNQTGRSSAHASPANDGITNFAKAPNCTNRDPGFFVQFASFV